MTDAIVEAVARAIAEAFLQPAQMWDGKLNALRPLIPVARAAIAAYEREGWRPIAEAPENTRVILYEPDGMTIGMARWGWSNATVNNWSEHSFATHFRPLPAPPEGQ